MNHDPNIIAAIDIGTTKIVAIAGRRMPNGKVKVLEIEQMPSTGVRRGVILNIEETSRIIKSVVSTLEERLDVSIKNVFVGIAGQHIRSMQNKVYTYIDRNLEIKDLDVKKLMDDNKRIDPGPGLKIIHIIPQDYTVDQEIVKNSPVGMWGRKLEGSFHIVMGSDSSLTNLAVCINRAGITGHDLILEPLASARSTVTEEEKEIGVVIVDIGGGTTDVAVFYDGIVRHTAVIPFGGNVITSDIKEGCSITPKQAESIKVRYGSAMRDKAKADTVISLSGVSQGWEAREVNCKNLASIIEARMSEIIEYVCVEIEKSGYYNRLGAGVVLTGGGAMLSDVVDLFKLNSGLDVRIGKPDMYTNNIAEESALASLSTAVGLLLCGAESAQFIERYEQPKLIDAPIVEKPAEEPRKHVKKVKEKTEKRQGFLAAMFEKVIDVVGNEDDVKF
jgi:cell division protein FtsA